MITARGSFFITGGTLGHDAPCYVERRADSELYHALLAGEFCYVLTSRQMGKSSLMIRTAARLRGDEVHVVVLDLTSLGRNLSVEQWYYGLLGHMGQQLGLRKELREFWAQQPLLSPLQRWIAAIREVILPRCTGRLVIFIDEIDAVRSLPFSTDEFFAGVRECYNRRSQDPLLRQLTFCFLGVAAPSELMQEVRTTPFNIGRRIELSDFTEAEAKPLAIGLSLGELGVLERSMQQARALLKRVLYWTGGHPYLTQRLCLGVVSTPGVTSAEDVDEVCVRLFLSDAAREKDDNLIFVRDRMLRSEVDLIQLLQLYARIHAEKRVRDNPSQPVYRVLHLSGIVKEERGLLYPRNRIYSTVFNREWVNENLPREQLNRRRAEAWGLLARRAAVFSLAAAGIGSAAGITFFGLPGAPRASRELQAYVSMMRQAEASYEAGDVQHLTRALERYGPAGAFRGFEWRHLWRLAHEAAGELPQPAPVRGASVSSEGNRLFVLHEEGLSAWSLPDGAPVLNEEIGDRTSGNGVDSTSPSACSADGWRVAVIVPGSGVELIDRRKRIRHRLSEGSPVGALALSPDGETLAIAEAPDGGGADSGSLQLWSVTQRRLLRRLAGVSRGVSALTFSETGAVLAAGSGAAVRIWKADSGQLLQAREWEGERLDSLALSPDGSLGAAAVKLRTAWEGPRTRLEIWDRRTGRVVRVFPALRGRVRSLAFAPDSGKVAAGKVTGEVEVYPLREGASPVRFLAHTGPVAAVCWSPDGKRVVSGGTDQYVRLWDVTAPAASEIVTAHSAPLLSLSFSADSRRLVTAAEDGAVRSWDLATMRPVSFPCGRSPKAAALPDGRLLLVDARGARLRASPEQPPVSVSGFTPRRVTAVSPDGLWAASAEGREVTLWNSREQRSESLPTADGDVEEIVIAPGGRWVAIRRAGEQVQLWDPRRPRAVTLIAAPGGRALAFDAAGKQLALAADCDIRVRDLATGRETRLQGHGAPVRALAISPDGRTLASGDHTPTLRLWNLPSGLPVGAWQIYLQSISRLAFAPNGNTLAASDAEGNVQLWRADPR